ncbi:cell division protein [Sphingomonas oleivorans]|uniref:Cell division protein n=1 Tax=Sphingomonas oleivorans TaxID=1735121 RepID=A0A2T5G2F6_9SPHN|nr:FtsX-like permease family protein [Sphingomonas oleivorans]PTQ13333.1 cell division protein [Sphingomonas oleivorans]
MSAASTAMRASNRRLLPEGRLEGPLPWLIAIMMFLMVLAAALGLGLGRAAASLADALAGRVTVQIVEGDPRAREAQARAAQSELGRIAGIRAVRRVDDAEMRALLEPWLGNIVNHGDDLPLPAMIDVDIAPGEQWRLAAIGRTLARIAPAARIDDHGRSLAPLAGLIASLTWLAIAIVLLMATATGFVVVLATRSALDTHHATIEVLHLLGATDSQIARLFQRRIALDALLGGAIGLACAAPVIFLLGLRLGALGSELAGTVALWPAAWLLLGALPLAGAGLATIATRRTVLGALRRTS